MHLLPYPAHLLRPTVPARAHRQTAIRVVQVHPTATRTPAIRTAVRAAQARTGKKLRHVVSKQKTTQKIRNTSEKTIRKSTERKNSKTIGESTEETIEKNAETIEKRREKRINQRRAKESQEAEVWKEGLDEMISRRKTGQRRISRERIGWKKIGTRTSEAKREKDRSAKRGESVQLAKREEDVRLARTEEGVRSARIGQEAGKDQAARRVLPANLRAAADREVWTSTRNNDHRTVENDTDDRQVTVRADEGRRSISTREKEETAKRAACEAFSNSNLTSMAYFDLPLFCSSIHPFHAPPPDRQLPTRTPKLPRL